MKFVRIIDNNGIFLRDDFVEEINEFTIETPCPIDFYQPKWNGTEWIEGLTQEEIDVRNNAIQEATEVEELANYVLDVDFRIVMLEMGL